MQSQNFVHLNVHTEFSLKNSLVRIPGLVAATKEAGMPAVAVTDSSNMFGSIKHYKKSLSAGVKPIISAQLNIHVGGQLGYMSVIAKNDIGYKNLIEVLSEGYEEGSKESGRDPVIEFEKLAEKSEGLIVLSGAKSGPLGPSLLAGKDMISDDILSKFKETFGDNFYLELQRTNHPDDDKHVHAAAKKAVQYDLPVVATNAVMFLEREEFESHEVRAAIAAGTTVSEMRKIDPYKYSREQFLKSPEEMMEIFSDIPSAIQNSVEIAKQCNVEITLGKNFLPAFPDAQNANQTENEYLRSESFKGLDERLKKILDVNDPEYDAKKQEYIDRLEFELNVVIEMGFPGYFEIVSDFIQWSKDNGIPVGPGRGSGAGSLIAYALKITDLDPLEFDLLFERFLNPERVSMPDFDIDFCMDRREEVIKYTSEKYGEKAVSQIITYGTMAAKMVVKDVSRALGMPYAVGNRISQMIPAKPGTKLKEAIEESSEFQFAIETDSEVKKVIEHSLKLEGLTRQTGKHAGGVLIAPGKLTDFTATYNEVDKEGNVINRVSQLDKNDVEEAGLVKFDFLGLKTLTIINNAVININARRKKEGLEPIDIDYIDRNDESVYELFQSGKTAAVFQVESPGMQELLKELRPDCFEDVIALVALYRPGPLESGMVKNFINRKHGREEVSYPDATYQHESLKDILEPTYGVILYQEQVMQIAQVLAGYSLGEADMLRRAMGKKKPEEMAKQRAGFEAGAIANGIDGQLAMKIFDLVEKFAGYGFNKSHSAAYALIAYQTAWLKKHYPSEFMASVISGDMDTMEKVVAYVNECRDLGLEILPPDVNESIEQFHPKNASQILFGMGAVKGVGESAIKQILEERAEGGEFKSLYDFCMRCNPKKTMIEPGIRAGLLDNLGPSRSSLMATYPQAVLVGKQAAKKEKDSVQLGMFGSLMDDQDIVRFEQTPQWDDLTRLAGERKTLGLYLTGHPIEFYEEELSTVVSGSLMDLAGTNMEAGNDDLEATEETASVKWEDKNVTVSGLIMDLDIRTNKKGQTAFLKIDDKSRQLDVMIFNKAFHECQHLLELDQPVVIDGRLKMDKRTKKVRLFANDVRSIDMVRERHAGSIHLELNETNFSSDKRDKLKEIVESQPRGYASITARYKSEKHDREMTLGDHEVKVTDDLINSFRELFGKECVSVVYRDKANGNIASVKKMSDEEVKLKLEEGERTRETRHSLMAATFEEARVSLGM